MRIRYQGEDTRWLALSGGSVECPPGEWVDVIAAAAEAGISQEHAIVAARGLVDQPGWDVEGVEKKTKPTRGPKPSTQAAEKTKESA